MAKRRFPTPRSYAVFPKQFGKESKDDNAFTGWNAVDSVAELVGLRAAEVHHEWSLEARRRVKGTGRTMGALEEEMDLGKRRLGKLLNGHAHLALNDAFRVEAVLGPILFGVRVRWWPVINDALAERYPNAKAVYSQDGYDGRQSGMDVRD